MRGREWETTTWEKWECFWSVVGRPNRGCDPLGNRPAATESSGLAIIPIVIECWILSASLMLITTTLEKLWFLAPWRRQSAELLWTKDNEFGWEPPEWSTIGNYRTLTHSGTDFDYAKTPNQCSWDQFFPTWLAGEFYWILTLCWRVKRDPAIRAGISDMISSESDALPNTDLLFIASILNRELQGPKIWVKVRTKAKESIDPRSSRPNARLLSIALTASQSTKMHVTSGAHRWNSLRPNWKSIREMKFNDSEDLWKLRPLGNHLIPRILRALCFYWVVTFAVKTPLKIIAVLDKFMPELSFPATKLKVTIGNYRWN